MVFKCSFWTVTCCLPDGVSKKAIGHCSRSFVFMDVAIFLPSHLNKENKFPYMSKSIPILYLWVKSSPKIRCCFNFVHTMKLCAKFWSSMFNSNGAIPINPNVTPLAVFTFEGFLLMLTISVNFMNICWDMHEHVAAVSNKVVIDLVLRRFTAKFGNFYFWIF